MFIEKINHAFAVGNRLENAVCEILEPICIEGGREITVPFVSCVDGRAEYRDDKNEVTLTLEQKTDTLFYLRRMWKNTSDEIRTLRMAQRV